MKLSKDGALLIERFEGFVSHPYRDAVGVWTIGFGSTKGVGPGSPPVSRDAAEARMMREVDATYGAAVNRIGIPLTQHQFDALTSFVYNVGPGGVAASTTVGRRLRARDYAGAADALLAWNKADGRVLAGLTTRRQAERALFLSASPPPKPAAPEMAGWLSPTELRWCLEYDKLIARPTVANRARRRSLRRAMTAQRKRIWRAAHEDGGWARANRAKRYASLKARTT